MMSATQCSVSLKQTVSLRISGNARSVARVARRSTPVKMQASAAVAPPASGDIKDKNAELAINGTCGRNVCEEGLTHGIRRSKDKADFGGIWANRRGLKGWMDVIYM